MKAIINAKIVTENGLIWDGAITWENGRILQADWADKVSIPADAEIIDAGGLYAAPGFIDIHNHGGPTGRWDQDPQGVSAFHLCHGTTTALPTLAYQMSLEEMLKANEIIRANSQSGPGRIMSGLYMEGPYMGGHSSNQKFVRWQGEIKKEEYGPLVEATKGYARIWAIDPAREGVEDFMKDVKAADPNAMFAFGHSRATFADCRRVRKLGVTVQTHFNDSGQAPGRAQGTAGAGCDHYSLHEPDMYAELICDEVGVHVDADLIKTLVRTKGVEHVILITDHADSKYPYTNNEADGIMFGPDLNYDYEGHLCGSCMTLNGGIRNMMKHTAYGLCHAVRMASLNPARLLGIDDEVGSLEPGKRANLVLIDDMVHIKSVYLDGEHMVQDGELV